LTADEFRRWCERRGYTQEDAAAALNASQSAVSRWMAGKRGIPGPVVRLIALLDERDGREARNP
jgi:transcriptional regulator with XRE-family HTH domain